MYEAVEASFAPDAISERGRKRRTNQLAWITVLKTLRARKRVARAGDDAAPGPEGGGNEPGSDSDHE